MGDKANILDTLSREELGIDPEELGGSPYEAAFMSFFLFAVGAAFPIFPFFFWSGANAIYISLIVSALWAVHYRCRYYTDDWTRVIIFRLPPGIGWNGSRRL